MIAPKSKGWCPGVLTPMESGDGLIVRLKLTGGIVPLDLAGRIADCSHRWGNGQIDLTQRANLQIRGLTEGALLALQDAMAAEGLLDVDPDGEAVRNVIASPLAGIDPTALLDIRPIVVALEARLTTDPSLHRLPAKFCFAVDDGGRLPLTEVRADIRFEAIRSSDGVAFAAGFDGAPEGFGPVAPEVLVDTAAALAKTFIVTGAKRMRELVERGGVSRITAFAPLSVFPCREKPKTVLPGIGLPFGRIASADFATLTKAAADAGASEIRLTPWRTVIVPTPSPAAAERVWAVARALGLILDPTDPRRRVAACVGAPACGSATTDIRAAAERLAPIVGDDVFLHVSGCTKGCAHPRSAPVTLVGRDGLYDLVRGGRPCDAPAATGLTLDEAARHLREMTAVAAEDNQA